MDLKAVLFDMDGVLIDSEIYYAQGTYQWMQEYGYSGPIDEMYKLIGTTMETTYAMLCEMLDNKLDVSEIKEINENFFKENPIPHKEVLKEGVLEILKLCKENQIKTAICSSSSYDTIMEVVKECELKDYFDFITSGEHFKESKPNPEIYLCAANKLNAQPNECLVIEDSTIGVEAAIRAKMEVIAIKDERFNLDHSKANHIVASLNDATQIIKIRLEK